MNTQIQQPICTLYIKLSEIDATADLLYHTATEGDITALDDDTLMGAMSNLQSMVKECKEAVAEVESASYTKPGVSVVTGPDKEDNVDTDRDQEDDPYDRLTMKFEKLGAILYNLHEHENIHNMTKGDASVFLGMAVEIFDGARDDARELHQELCNATFPNTGEQS